MRAAPRAWRALVGARAAQNGGADRSRLRTLALSSRPRPPPTLTPTIGARLSAR